VGGPCKVVVKKASSSFETLACQDMSLGANDLNCVESSELAAAEYYQERD
jgi:hypothetical protein